MYIQITTLCNMACAHCSFACDPRKPFDHMPYNVYMEALEVAYLSGDNVCIGGGEPTVHPEFWRYLREAVRGELESVWLATNGKRTSYALALAQLGAENVEETFLEFWNAEWDEDEDPEHDDYPTREWLDERVDGTCAEDWKKFTCALSQDQWHDPINPSVIEAFKNNDLEIRNVGWNLVDAGAARENQLGGREVCACSEITVKPDGTVKMCGCEDSLIIGNIFDSDITEKIERVNQSMDHHNECGFWGLKEKDHKDEETGSIRNAPINESLVEFILEGKHSEHYNEWEKYETSQVG